MSDIAVNENEIEAFIRANPTATIETLTLRFPGADPWTLRNTRRDVQRAMSFADAGADEREDVEMSGLSKPAMTVLRSGFLRPISITLRDVPRPKPMFKKAGYQALVISDVHAPDHDPHALDVAIQVGQANDLDAVIVAGDFFDCHALSKYTPAAHRPFRWVDERAVAIQPAIQLREAFPDTDMYWIHGNHDIRPMSFVAAQAPQLQGLQTLEEMLGIKDLGFIFPKDNRLALADNQLLIKHGVTVSGEAGASAAKEVRKHGMSVIMGHVHRLAYYNVTRTAQRLSEEQPNIGIELGCLANLRPDYLPEEETANWQHGCAMVTIYDSGLYNVELVPIHAGNGFFRGRRFISRVK